MKAEELSESIGIYIREHMPESEKSAMRMEEYIKHSDLNAAAIIIPVHCRFPKYMTGKRIETFSEIVDVTYGDF